MQITILNERLPEARKLLDKLVRKAQRYGNPDIAYSIGEIWNVPVKRRHPFTGVVSERPGPEMVTIEVVGDAPRVGPFEFLAKIEHGGDGNILDVVPGREVDIRFRSTASVCEHCRTKRQRKETFVMNNTETGEMVQVGRSCLKDYLGYEAPAGMIQKFAFLREFEAMGNEDGEWGRRADTGFFVDEAMAATAVAIRLFGWCSKQQAHIAELDSTAGIVSAFLRPPVRDKYNDDLFARNDRLRAAVLETDMAYAQSAREWAVAGGAGNSDYGHNLKVLCGRGHIEGKRLGLICSAVPAYERAQDREVERTARAKVDANSAWQGEVKERLRNIPVTQIDARVVGANDWGEIVLVKFRDDAGNLFTWFTGGGSGLNTGDRAELTGTVKAHTEFKGVHETQLSRCTVTKAPALVAA